MWRRFASWVLPLALPIVGTVPGASAGADPTTDAAAFELHPALGIALFAGEPDVIDPVALTFDEFGRAYVVEMRDYPYGLGPGGQPGGTVRMLEDLDGDGRADRSTLFAGDLAFPTSILAWDGGVLVLAPPEVIFLKDTDGDGHADRREIVLTGLERGVTDSNASGLRYGLDNWIHAVNGGNGGSIVAPRHPADPVPLGDRDFRFRPATGAIDLTAHTGGGFGLVFDDWGRSFTPHNVNHLQQRVLDVDDLRRFPGLPPIATTHSISDHGEMARIFPVSPAQTRPNHPEQAGHFSAAGGMGYLGHRDWPGDLPGSVLVCDVVGNLVHRDVLLPDGPILRATRAPGEQTREFLASRDNRFRPVGLELGPDGALYLLDMQRDVIEHPDYIPKKTLETQDIRAGDNRGRIYRVAPKDWPTHRELPGHATPDGLVRLLESPNQWTRQTAQRLLVSRALTGTVPALRALVRHSAAPLARLHALWTLEGLEHLDEDSLVVALEDPTPGVRAQAVTLARPRLRASPRLAIRTETLLATDPEAEVRFHAALAAGDRDWVRAADLVQYLRRDHAFPWSRRAAFSSLGPLVHAIGPIFSSREVQTNLTPAKLDLARELAEVRGATTLAWNRQVDDCDFWAADPGPPRPDPTGGIRFPTLDPDLDEGLQIAILEGFSRGLARRDPALPRTVSAASRTALGSSLDLFLRHWPSPPLLAALFKVTRQLGLPDSEEQQRQLRHWIGRVLRQDLPAPHRAGILPLLAFGDFAELRPTFAALLQGTEPAVVQAATLEVLRDPRDPEVARLLVSAWPSLSPALRPAVVNLLVYRRPFHPVLLDALEAGHVQVGELNLDLEQRRQLLRRADDAIRTRAAAFVSDEEYSNRQAIVEQWLPRLPAVGHPEPGRATFDRLCATCHVVGDHGHRVGPDLTGLGYRSVEDLLSHILDPNMAVNPNYAAFTAEQTDGEEETGILGADSGSSISLLQASGRVVEIPRDRLRSLRSSGRSLMPEGLEAGLSPQDLRDLIAYLQQPAPAPAAAGEPR